jgi:hypothetical protein
VRVRLQVLGVDLSAKRGLDAVPQGLHKAEMSVFHME